MKVFSRLYNYINRISRTKYSTYVLVVVSVTEAIFLPVPPDLFLIAKTLANKYHWQRYALITTIFSIIGGIIGYFLGLFFIGLLEPVLIQFDYYDYFITVKQWFVVYGFWVIFVAGFTPIPYKIFTIFAGSVVMNLLIFVLASVVSRGLRFYLVAFLAYKFEGEFSNKLLKYVDLFGWIIVLSCLGYYWGLS